MSFTISSSHHMAVPEYSKPKKEDAKKLEAEQRLSTDLSSESTDIQSGEPDKQIRKLVPSNNGMQIECTNSEDYY